MLQSIQWFNQFLSECLLLPVERNMIFNKINRKYKSFDFERARWNVVRTKFDIYIFSTRVSLGSSLTCLTPSYFCACLNPVSWWADGVVILVFSDLRCEIVVRFVGIDGFRASKKSFARRNKNALGPRGQTETSLKIEDLRSNKTTGKLSYDQQPEYYVNFT